MEQKPYQVEPTAGGYRYRLPGRNTSEYKTIAWTLLAFGAFGSLFMLSWISMPVGLGIGMLLQNNLFGLALIAFGSVGLFGLLQTSRIVAAGIAILKNDLRCEIEIQDRYLYCTELMGWTSWKRKTLIRNVSRLEIVKSKEDQTDLPNFLFGLEKLALINAVGENESKSFRLAVGYKDSVLLPLAEELALRLNKLYEPSYSKDAKGITKPVSTIVTTITESASDEDSDFSKQPVNSKVEIIRKGESIAFSVPPAGKGGTHGLYFFSIAWLAFTSLFSLFIISGLVFEEDGLGEAGIWVVLGVVAFLLVFFAAGVGMLLGAMNMAKRTVMLGVNNGSLFIERKSIFGTKWIEFERENVAAICKGPSGMSVNDVPVMELQIIDADGAKQGLLSQLPANEINWLAHELTEALGVPSGLGDPKSLVEIIASAKSHPNWPQPPTGPLELVQLNPKCRAISVPAHGIGTRAGSIFSGCIMLIAGLITGPILIFYFGQMIPGLAVLTMLAFLGSLILYLSLTHALTRFDIIALSNSKDDSIGVLKNGFLEKRQFDFPRDSNPKIKISTSEGLGNNNAIFTTEIKRVFSVKIRNAKANVKLMSGHNLADVRYVAAHLAEWVEEGKAHTQNDQERSDKKT